MKGREGFGILSLSKEVECSFSIALEESFREVSGTELCGASVHLRGLRQMLAEHCRASNAEWHQQGCTSEVF